MRNTPFESKFSAITEYVERSIFPRLPQHLYYHNLSHTMNDVLPASIRLAEMEAVTGDDLFLLEVAVLFHDTGFIEQYSGNEIIGAEIAGKVLQKFDFTNDQISRIKKLIMATQVKIQDKKYFQMAGEDILEKIICDADLDNLGRDDYFEKRDLIRTEMAHFGKSVNDKDWIEYQFLLLETHEYLTESAKKLRADGQMKNLAKLKIQYC